MAGKSGDGGKKQKQKHSMEAKFIRTKPLPAQPSPQTVSTSKNAANSSKNEKTEKKAPVEKEKDQLKEQYWAKLLATGLSRENIRTDTKANFSEADWMEVRQYFNHAYHQGNDDSKQFVKKNRGKITKVIKRLCAKDSQQLLLFLESQVQEFVIEVKVKLLELLKKAGQPNQVARNFLTRLVELYASLCSGASSLTGALQDLEEKHLAMFVMSWEDLNRLLFERCVHSDPVIQLKIPQFVSQLQGSLNQKDKGGFYGVVRRLLVLEDDMKSISEEWKRVENFIHEKNVSSLSNMVSQLKIDLCDNKGTKKQCTCGICSSTLLQQLAQLGITQNNGKGSKDKLLTVLEQRALKMKTNCNNNPKGSEGGKQAQSTSKPQSQEKVNSSKQPQNGKQGQQKNAKGNSNQKNQKPEPQSVKSKEPQKGKEKNKLQQQVQKQPPPPQPQAEPSKKTKQKNAPVAPTKASTSPEHKPSKKEIKENDPGDSRSLNDLLQFIEGTDGNSKDEKKAAKKARQKMKKIQDGDKRVAATYEEPPAAVIKVPKPAAGAQFITQKGDKKEPQMVTIRRVMEPSSSEPTVTITLKGDTPDHDKVLFTLVNGQVKEDKAKGKGQQPATQSQSATKERKKKNKKKNNAQQPEPVPPVPTAQPLLLPHQQMPPERFMVSSGPYQQAPKPHVTVTPIMGPPFTARSEMSVSDFCAQQPNLGPFRAPTVPTKSFQDDPSREQGDGHFSLQNIKLPPGITITKVEAPKIVRPEPPPPVKKEEPQNDYGQYQQGGTMIVNMPQSLPPSSYQPHNLTAAQMGSMRNMGMQNPNVIVVDTGKLMDEEVSNHNYVNNHNGMWQQTNGTLKHPNLGGGGIVLNGNHHPNGQDQSNGGGKKRKNKKKGKKGEEWNLVESVFAPKDIDLDAVDDDERELEAFKRFCFNSVPPEHKEKVHLNLKDLVIKKKP